MKIVNLYLIAAILAACTTTPVQRNRDLSVAAIESVKINDDSARVKSALGAPSEVRSSKRAPELETWIYDDTNGSERAAIDIDSASKKVTGITILPGEQEPEFKLNYLLKSKYSQIEFMTLPRRVCGRDYIPPQVFHIDTKTGVVIQANENTGEVESLGRLTPTSAAVLIEKIKNCQR